MLIEQCFGAEDAAVIAMQFILLLFYVTSIFSWGNC